MIMNFPVSVVSAINIRRNVILSVVEISEKSVLEPLFSGWEETMIYSCLQGLMGRAYADNERNPQSAQLLLGDFCFFSGKPDKDLIRNKPSDWKSGFIIMVPRDQKWASAIEEVWKSSAKKVSRYAIKKNPHGFNREHLEKIVRQVPAPFSLRMIDQELYDQIMAEPWSRDLCAQFEGYEDYKTRGIGVAAVVEGRVVSGASSYSVYREGIEIEIDTRADYRRRGAALACGAKLILECLDKGLYPSWDAQNPGSVALSEKLGYEFDYEYHVYEIIGF